MELESSRLYIREWRTEDWADMHLFASDPKVTEYVMWGPNQETDTQVFIEQQLVRQQAAERTDYEFAVVLKETHELIGGCGIFLNGLNAEIGYCYNPDYWGHGYATEAAQVMLKLGFEQFWVHRIYATCRPANVASANVMRRIGMKQEGHLREHLYSKGRYHDSYLFSILEDEYKQLD